MVDCSKHLVVMDAGNTAMIGSCLSTMGIHTVVGPAPSDKPCTCRVCSIYSSFDLKTDTCYCGRTLWYGSVLRPTQQRKPTNGDETVHETSFIFLVLAPVKGPASCWG